MESVLDSLVYRNLFDVTELALDLVNINIPDKEKRYRIKNSFLIISRKQKNRIIDGLSFILNHKRSTFVAGCFLENASLIKKRILILSEIEQKTRENACTEIDNFTKEKIALVEKLWNEKGINDWTKEEMDREIKVWRMWK